MDPDTVLIGSLSIVLAAFLLSANNVAQVFYYQAGGTVAAMLLARYVLFVIAAGALMPLLGVSLRTGTQTLTGLAVSGTLYALAMVSLMLAIYRMDVSIAILTLYTFPIVLKLMEALADRRPPGIAIMVAAVAAFVGLAVALEVHQAELEVGGLAWASLASLCFAGTFFWNGRHLTEAGPGPVTFYMKLIGLPLIIAYAATRPEPVFPPVGPEAYIPFALSVGAYLLAFVAMVRGIGWAGAGRASQFMNLEPVFTMGFAALALGDALSTPRIAGAAIVIAAILIAQKFESCGAGARDSPP